jgi:serine/threonine protein kinase
MAELISQGEACISDFGMAKVIEDVTKTSASTTLQNSGCARWLAPEIVEGESPSKASDTYSFAMAILELLTGTHPLAELKSDIAIIRAMARAPIQPRRPTMPEVKQLLGDDLWALMSKCWLPPAKRPTMQYMSDELQKVQNDTHT